MLLKNKNAMVTGCNRGIGKAVLEKFAFNGANVFAHSRRQTDEFESFCRDLENKHNVEIIPIYFDVTKEDDMVQGIKKIISYKKNIDILVNNVGAVNQVKLFQMTKIQEMRDEFEINFFAQMRITQLISKLMIRNNQGSIINISSCAGLDGNTGMLEYVSSKAAIIGATKRLAIELGNYNIRVNSVAPGLTDTDMGGKMSSELENATLNRLIIKRKAKPEEIADAVVFFASNMSTFITGQVLRVDGGSFN